MIELELQKPRNDSDMVSKAASGMVAQEQPDTLMIKAYALRSAGMLEPAIDACLAAISASGGREDAVLLGCELTLAMGKSETAFLAPLVEQFPQSPSLLSAYGAALHAEGQDAAAVSMFSKAFALKTTDFQTTMRFATLLLERDDPSEAARVFEMSISSLESARDRSLQAATVFARFGHKNYAAHFVGLAKDKGPEDAIFEYYSSAIQGGDTPDRAPAEFVSKLFDEHASSFDENLASLAYCGPQLIAETLSDLSLDGSSCLAVLDAGCGTGLCGPVVRPVAQHLTGIDLSDGMLAQASDVGCYDHLEKLDITHAGARFPEKFDLVISADVLSYFGSLVPLLESYRACLRPGGRIIVTIEEAKAESAPNGFSLQPSGRFQHRISHLREAARAVGFDAPQVQRRSILRFEYEYPVYGFVFSATSVQ